MNHLLGAFGWQGVVFGVFFRLLRCDLFAQKSFDRLVYIVTNFLFSFLINYSLSL